MSAPPVRLERDGALAVESDLQDRAGRTADHAEGVRAFLAKRPAEFRGA